MLIAMAAVTFAFSILVGLFGGMGAGFGAQFRSSDDDGMWFENFDNQTFQYNVLQFHTTTRIQRRRDYADAREKCRDLHAAGHKDIVCPDINDFDAIRAFLAKDFSQSDTAVTASEGSEDEPVHAAAPESSLEYSDLDADGRTLLRQYLRREICPEGMEKFLSGFYNLCTRMVEEGYTRNRPRRAEQDRAARARVRAILRSTRVP